MREPIEWNAVAVDLAQQRKELARKWEGRPDTAEKLLDVLDIAVAVYTRLHHETGLRDHGTLVPSRAITNPRNVVRITSHREGPLQTTKIEGNVTASGEHIALRTFLEHGIRCVTPIAEEIVRVEHKGSIATARISSTHYVPGAMSLAQKFPNPTLPQRLELIGRITAFLAPLHDERILLPTPESWTELIDAQLDRIDDRHVAAIRQCLAELDDHPRVPLHGNPHDDNIVEDPNGGWWLLDPYQVVGPPDGEIGMLVSDMAARPSQMRQLVDAAAEDDKTLAPDRLRRFCRHRCFPQITTAAAIPRVRARGRMARSRTSTRRSDARSSSHASVRQRRHDCQVQYGTASESGVVRDHIEAAVGVWPMRTSGTRQ